MCLELLARTLGRSGADGHATQCGTMPVILSTGEARFGSDQRPQAMALLVSDRLSDTSSPSPLTTTPQSNSHACLDEVTGIFSLKVQHPLKRAGSFPSSQVLVSSQKHITFPTSSVQQSHSNLQSNKHICEPSVQTGSRIPDCPFNRPHYPRPACVTIRARQGSE